MLAERRKPSGNATRLRDTPEGSRPAANNRAERHVRGTAQAVR